MKQVFKTETLEWSNLFFLVPIFLAIIYSMYWYAAILLVVFIVSFNFHFLHEAKRLFYLDVIFSSLLMLSNFILLFLGHWKIPYSIFAVAFSLIALFFYFRRKKHAYYLNHSLWHIFSAGVCFFCLMTFLGI
jgi:hypothetical protein